MVLSTDKFTAFKNNWRLLIFFVFYYYVELSRSVTLVSQLFLLDIPIIFKSPKNNGYKLFVLEFFDATSLNYGINLLGCVYQNELPLFQQFS